LKVDVGYIAVKLYNYPADARVADKSI